jgi:4-amino-4-deoxy-L-arabinose transferase-like glycosyltransferase
MAISPSAAFFGRTFLSDTPMLCFSVWAVWGWVRYFASGSTSHAGTAGLLTALACLVKIPAVLILAPIAMAGWTVRGWKAAADRRALSGIGFALLATGLWYWQAERIYQQTGLTQSIWHPSGTYAADVFTAARQGSGVSHWGSLERLSTYDFYGELINRTYSLHLTPIGFLMAGVGLVVAFKTPARRVVDAWLAAVVAFILATAEGQYWHEFHQLPLIPVAALYFGLATRWMFSGPALAQVTGVRLGAAWMAAVLAVCSVLTFIDSGVIASLYRPERLDYNAIRLGRAVGRMVAADQLVVANQYETNGNNSPILLYHAHRRGWSFDVRSLTPQLLERLRTRFDAHFFATMDWDLLRRVSPDTAAYLQQHAEIALVDVPSEARLFDLRTPLGP